MWLSNVVYVVDYDLSTSDESHRTYFYRKLHRKMSKLYGARWKFSTQSCYFTEDEEVAKKFYEIVKEFCTRATIYRAQEMERFGKREKQ